MRQQEVHKFSFRIDDRCQAPVLGILGEVLHMIIIDQGETILRDRWLSYVATDVINDTPLRYKGTHKKFHFRLPSVSKTLFNSSRLRSDSSTSSLLAVSSAVSNAAF